MPRVRCNGVLPPAPSGCQLEDADHVGRAGADQFLLGRPEAVVEHLEAEHSDDIQARAPVLFDAEYDPVRELPSFKAWLARHKLTEAHERAQTWRTTNPVSKG
jgi:hypothetical protein